MKVKEYTPLHEAVYSGKVDTVKELISSGKYSPNVCTERNENALHYAMCHGKVDLIRPLVELGVNVNKMTYQGLSPLVMALLNDHEDCLRELLSVCKELNVDLDVNRKNMFGECALHHAATHYKLEACKLLIEYGANVNATVGDEETTVLDLASQPIQQDEHHHHHHHHEHGEACNHDHEHDEQQLQLDLLQRQKCIDLIKEHGGVVGTKSPDEHFAIPTPDEAPEFIRHGISNDQTMMVHEERFGGAMWADYLQAFYAGKKPCVGYACEIKLLLSQPISGLRVVNMYGIIHSVSDDKKTFTATVKLNPEQEQKLESLAGNWEATMTFLPSRATPYVLKKFVPVSDPAKSFDNLLKEAHEREEVEGRKIAKKTEMPSPCVTLKGDEDSHHGHDHEHKILIGIDVVQQSQLVYYYEDGTQDIVEGSHLPLLFQRLVEQNMELKSQGKEGIFIKVNGKEVHFDVVEGDHDHDHDHDHEGGCCGHHHH